MKKIDNCKAEPTATELLGTKMLQREENEWMLLADTIRLLKAKGFEDAARQVENVLEHELLALNSHSLIKPIMLWVCAEMGVPLKMLKSPKRNGNFVYARRMLIWACRELLLMRYTEIAELLDRNHATIMNAYTHAMDDQACYPAERHRYARLRKYVLELMKNNGELPPATNEILNNHN